MSKQEVIEILSDFLYRAYCDGRFSGLHHDSRERAKALYDRIAPLREFPEKQLRGLLTDKDLWTEEGLLYQIRLLFEGELPSIFDPSVDAFVSPSPTVGGNTPEQKRQDAMNKARSRGLAQMEQDKPKGTCQKCGGSGRRPLTALGRIGPTDVCPNCKGTGEEERIGDERRVSNKIDGIVMRPNSSNFNAKGRIFLAGLDEGGLVEVWKTDRRADPRVLIDRRKAVSGDAQKAT